MREKVRFKSPEVEKKKNRDLKLPTPGKENGSDTTAKKGKCQPKPSKSKANPHRKKREVA